MRRLTRSAHNERGGVFITTIIATFMMTLMAAGIFALTSQDISFISRLKRSTQARHLAEAGLARALSTLSGNWAGRNTPANFPLTTLAQGTYDATVTEPTTDHVFISSVGTVDGVQRVASAEATAPTTSALAYMLAGGSALDLRLTAFSTCVITGDIYAANSIQLKATANAASITASSPGGFYAGGTINNGGGNITYGSLNPNYSGAVGFPVIDWTYYQTIASTNGYYYSSSKTYNSVTTLPVNPSGGVLFVNGDITISDAQPTTRVCIIATGKIDITKGTTTIQQFSTFPALMTRDGDITIRSVGASAQGALIATGLVYAGNNFSISGNHNSANVTGSILARGTLGETGTQCSLVMSYVQQNPTGMISNGGQPMVIESYNR